MKQSLGILLSVSALLFLLYYASPVSSAHDDHPQKKAANPLLEEMMTLDKVFRDVVSAVALRDNEKVHKALESMHGTMEKSHEGVHTGSVVIPKNAQRVEDFEKMDRKFHEKLDALASAAHRNNQREVLRITKQLLDGCVRCHEMFRR
jgi:cytochrome c556